MALKEPRKFRYFFSSTDFVAPSDAGPAQEPTRTGAVFAPRLSTAAQSSDIDGRLTAHPEPAQPEAAPVVAEPADKPIKLVPAAIADSLQAARERPPRAIWLPVLGEPLAVDELVARWRGRPWFVDYDDNPGLFMPAMVLADFPRGARQEAHCLDLLRDNALILAAPNRGATTAVMTMVSAAAMLYRPDRVQFYCIAASGPQLARVADLPHVATVVAGSDGEGAARVVATVEAIATERDRIFTTQRLDMDKVRAAKFGLTQFGGALSAAELSAAGAVSGGEVVLVIDGWKNFSEAYPELATRVAGLMRARNYGVRVVYTHTSSISGISTAVKTETGQTLELKLINEHDTSVKRNPADPERNPVREVPDIPGRGLTQSGHHLMVGVPVLAHPPHAAGSPRSRVRACRAMSWPRWCAGSPGCRAPRRWRGCRRRWH